MRTWRILRAEFQSTPLSGVGAALVGGRWNSRGHEAVYTADTLATAVLEVLVHLDGGIPEAPYLAAEIDLDDDLGLFRPTVRDLPTDWDRIPPSRAAADFGDRWLASLDAVGMIVPSVVIRGHTNVMLNPGHVDFSRVHVVDLQPFVFDRRLLYRLST